MCVVDWSLVIQAAAVLVAAIAVVVGVAVAAIDRRKASDLAAVDRLSAIRRDRLRFELDVAIRLAENLNRGGSSDTQESRRMGTEALVLIGTLGRDRVPNSWDRRIEKDDAELHTLLEDQTLDQWKRDGIEAQLAVHAILKDLGSLEDEAEQSAQARAARL